MAEAGPAHLSIGEVLGLLLEEFPDVTISKIRFLESQGLIEPERTPSGYRKFFDDDVELLRLILREQREKFLPLRVIKDRLDSGEIEPPDPTPSRGLGRAGTPEPSRGRQAPVDGTRRVVHAAGAPTSSTTRVSVPAQPPEPAAPPTQQTAPRAPSAQPALPAPPAPPASGGAPAARRAGQPATSCARWRR